MVLGHVIDVLNNTMDKHFICGKLLQKLSLSENDFYDYLDELSGRYFIMFHNRGTTKILSDATGMRSIIYSNKQTVIASHVKVVESIIGSNPSQVIKRDWKKKFSSYAFPGHFTPFEDIYFLTPNTLLEIETKRVKRFFPREPLELKNANDIAAEVSALVKTQLAQLSKGKNKLIFSLTAGIDSRSTLSLTKNFIDKIQFFTYYKLSKNLPDGVKSLEIDRRLVGDIVNNLNLNHIFIPLREDEKTEDYLEFIEMMKNNTISPHSYRLAKFYYDNFPKEALHIRSNILEIGRYFYRNKLDLPEIADAKALARCYSPAASDDLEVQSLFSEYYNVVEMENIFNYDPFDIFYWEYRMGVWHSQILLESDVAHDTFIPFNCRRILKLILSASASDKKNNTVFHRMISTNWNVLNYWGVNTLVKPIDRLDKQADDYGLSLESLELNSSSILGGHSVDFKYKNLGYKAKFYIDKSDPKKGDHVDASVPLYTPGDSLYHCIVQIRSPYENRKNQGRLKYQLLLNDNMILEEDIALWKESNQINIHFKTLNERSTLTIRIIAVKDCEKWNWGKAGAIIIERVVLRKSDKKIELIDATSPFSNIIKK